jgi:hypothetical protein
MLAGFADGFLLAAPSLAMDHIDSTIALVAGTGSVNLGKHSCLTLLATLRRLYNVARHQSSAKSGARFS